MSHLAELGELLELLDGARQRYETVRLTARSAMTPRPTHRLLVPLAAVAALATSTAAAATPPPTPLIYRGFARGVVLSLMLLDDRPSSLAVFFTPDGGPLRRRILRTKGGVSAFCAYGDHVTSGRFAPRPKQELASVALDRLPQRPVFTCGLQTTRVVKTLNGYRPVRLVSARMRRTQTSVTGTDYAIFGGSDRAAETAARPLDQALALLARPRRASDRLPSDLIKGQFPRPSLASVLAHLKGNPGAPLTGRSRLALSMPEHVYLVPTRHGWVCFVSQSTESCHQGLLKQGIAWSFHPDSQTSLTFYGLAASNVASVALVYAQTHRPARLVDGVFVVQRPIPPLSGAPPKLPPLGHLLIHYRDSRRTPATVELP